MPVVAAPVRPDQAQTATSKPTTTATLDAAGAAPYPPGAQTTPHSTLTGASIRHFSLDYPRRVIGDPSVVRSHLIASTFHVHHDFDKGHNQRCG
jgi:hypothetical protein